LPQSFWTIIPCCGFHSFFKVQSTFQGQCDGRVTTLLQSLDYNIGTFGGQYASEIQIAYLTSLENIFAKSIESAEFWERYSRYTAMQPTPLQLASRLTDPDDGPCANIWLKREDMACYGSYKSRGICGQILLVHLLGLSKVAIAVGSGKHGIAAAQLSSAVGLGCVIFMGSIDAERHMKEIDRMKALGAKVQTVATGCKSYRAAVTEAMRYSICSQGTGYVASSPIGPHPFPLIFRTFQSLMGTETKVQAASEVGGLPDAIVVPVGGGSAAVGMFHAFFHHASVRLIGVQSANSSALTEGQEGVFHGARTYVLQDQDGQIMQSRSSASDLSYPAVGPELAYWKKSGRVHFTTATDEEAQEGCALALQREELVLSMETSHAITHSLKLSRELGPFKNIIICCV
jgi:tryptophan synthase